MTVIHTDLDGLVRIDQLEQERDEALEKLQGLVEATEWRDEIMFCALDHYRAWPAGPGKDSFVAVCMQAEYDYMAALKAAKEVQDV
jgi:hypothetical protein